MLDLHLARPLRLRGGRRPTLRLLARSNEEPGPCLDRPRTIERVVLGQRVSAQSPSCQTRTLGMGQARLAATALSSRINLGAC
jgi:hypothetical protein